MINLTNLSPILIPLLAMMVPIVGVIAWAAVKIARLHMLHETVRKMSANGQPIPPEFIAQIVESKSSR